MRVNAALAPPRRKADFLIRAGFRRSNYPYRIYAARLLAGMSLLPSGVGDVVMFRQSIILAARYTPAALKKTVHQNPFLYRIARRVFSTVASYDGKIAKVASGPMAGMRLVV